MCFMVFCKVLRFMAASAVEVCQLVVERLGLFWAANLPAPHGLCGGGRGGDAVSPGAVAPLAVPLTPGPTRAPQVGQILITLQAKRTPKPTVRS